MNTIMVLLIEPQRYKLYVLSCVMKFTTVFWLYFGFKHNDSWYVIHVPFNTYINAKQEYKKIAPKIYFARSCQGIVVRLRRLFEGKRLPSPQYVRFQHHVLDRVQRLMVDSSFPHTSTSSTMCYTFMTDLNDYETLQTE